MGGTPDILPFSGVFFIGIGIFPKNEAYTLQSTLKVKYYMMFIYYMAMHSGFMEKVQVLSLKVC